MKSIQIPPYNVITWNINRDCLEFYDVMPYFVLCWQEEKKRKNKIWGMYYGDKGAPNGRMPETFEEFKAFIESNAHYNFWARCEYEVIVTGWPTHKNEYKLDVYEQIKSNLDIITKHFMDNIKGK